MTRETVDDPAILTLLDAVAARRWAVVTRAAFASRRAEIDAFRAQPVERVMQRLGERLKDVTISIQPWSNDALPSRLQVEQAAGGAQ